jgi:hypothetical protein
MENTTVAGGVVIRSVSASEFSEVAIKITAELGRRRRLERRHPLPNQLDAVERPEARLP